MENDAVLLYVTLNQNKNIIERLLNNTNNKNIENKLLNLYKDYINLEKEIKNYIEKDFDLDISNQYLRYKTEIDLLN